MYIQAINNLNKNYNFGNHVISKRAYKQTPGYGLDIFCKDRKPNDDDLCSKILKTEKNGRDYRFSPMQQLLLAKTIKNFDSSKLKSNILRQLLDIKSPSNEKLSFDDIIAFFYVMENTTAPQKNTVIQLVKDKVSKGKIGELNESLFVRIENCPQMLKHLTNLNNIFAILPEDKRCDLLNATFDVVENLNYVYPEFSRDIANVIANDETNGIYKILLEGAKKLEPTVNTRASKQKFKKLLQSFTPDKINLVKLSFTSIPPKEEQSYINQYLKNLDIE